MNAVPILQYRAAYISKVTCSYFRAFIISVLYINKPQLTNKFLDKALLKHENFLRDSNFFSQMQYACIAFEKLNRKPNVRTVFKVNTCEHCERSCQKMWWTDTNKNQSIPFCIQKLLLPWIVHECVVSKVLPPKFLSYPKLLRKICLSKCLANFAKMLSVIVRSGNFRQDIWFSILQTMRWLEIELVDIIQLYLFIAP